ncbi:MAG: hypothetical protein OI74_09185 [Gammaproteobacteria bacterium (ex Lamellibrachia satsuma)]|nr:MAG: hypothetical protein HPY30_14055 [Gammaproteobacteria bacterium (ex Lamellibrachia satsuma)]RRS33043.1 MAG: hypothetical protein OI74_09185 [Gammaproteobacteria bacterium (ex Lamellibrachia satsuma)]RRS36882.1 MAG: hypothetical protein NV67_04365 [Gammaproteobacteria bacterium (ex Lamellibrachia satsuma)]
MFGLSKRERYEKKVRVILSALSIDLPDMPGPSIAPLIEENFREHWNDVINEGIEKHQSPSLIAFMLAGLNFQDMLINAINESDRVHMQKCIKEKIYEFEECGAFLTRLKFYTMMGYGMSKRDIDPSVLSAMIRDIHRTLFGYEDSLDDTIEYMAQGSYLLKKELEESEYFRNLRAKA